MASNIITVEQAKAMGLIPGGKPRAKRKPPEVRTSDESTWVIVLVPACRVVSEANRSRNDHWVVKSKRVQAQKRAVDVAWCSSPLGLRHLEGYLPLLVTFTHIGPKMDDDNLKSAFKGCRDQVASDIGIDDGSDQVEWEYLQRLGTPGVEIRIEPKP